MKITSVLGLSALSTTVVAAVLSCSPTSETKPKDSGVNISSAGIVGNWIGACTEPQQQGLSFYQNLEIRDNGVAFRVDSIFQNRNCFGAEQKSISQPITYSVNSITNGSIQVTLFVSNQQPLQATIVIRGQTMTITTNYGSENFQKVR